MIMCEQFYITPNIYSSTAMFWVKLTHDHVPTKTLKKNIVSENIVCKGPKRWL